MKGHKVNFYDTYWIEEAKREFRVMYNQDLDEEIQKIIDYADKNNIFVESYFSKDYMKSLPKVSNHFGERINASSWTFLEHTLLYMIKRDLKILPEYNFKSKLELFSKNKYYISISKDVYNDYGNRTIGVQIKINESSFVARLDVSPYTIVEVPINILKEIGTKQDDVFKICLVEYIDLQGTEIPKELEDNFTPMSMRYFMFLSYTDKIKFINYINASLSFEDKLERASYCASLLEKSKKFQNR